MLTIKRFALTLCLLFVAAPFAAAQERMCDTSFEDCRQPLWDLIDHETVRIDVSIWFIQDTSLSNKLIARFQAGVPVRLICDPRANQDYSGNQAILNQLSAAGIPMRYKVADCIQHMKFMLFAGQNRLEFSGANYGPFFFVPNVPYQDYIDEAIYFTDDSSIINSFKTKMDDMWTDTSAYGNYANITGPLTRAYATFPINPDLNFPPSADSSQDFYNRTAQEMNQEQQKIDIIMYRITNDRYTNTTIAAVQRGVPVRLLTEQNEYRNRSRPWDSYNVDLLYMAGVQIRQRAHQGLNHEKMVGLYGMGESIFSSSNWTGPSSNCQAENNYFTKKAWILSWFANHFDRKWNSTTETQPFVPLPPDDPQYQSPANNATGVSTTNVQLVWEGREYAHKFDIYFGTSATPPLIAADQFIGRVDNGSTPETYTLPTLLPGTKYYWKIVSKTMANITASGPVYSFTTAGTPPPGPAPTVSNINPNSGTTAGGTSVTITGTNFVSGATVKLGGTAATGVVVSNSTTITATTPAHAAGAASVVVTNPDNQSGTLTNGFTYQSPPPGPTPTVSSITPNTGTTAGGTSVTISGTNFVSGALVKLGGTAATSVVVSNSTTITAATPAHAAGAVDVVVTNPDNQSATLTAGFTYQTPPPPPAGTLLQDDFNGAAIDTSKWNTGSLFSGFVDTGVPISQANQQLAIGPLPQGAAANGSHYRGVSSVNAYNFTGAYAQVELVQAPASNSAADAMLTIGRDSSNYYRIFVESGSLILQKRIGGTKTTLASVPFNAVNHRFWRIRHDASLGNVVFETAQGNAGVPGTWTQAFSEAWNTASVPLANMLFELKAGTYATEANAPGTVIFDNFKAAVPGAGPAPTVSSIAPNAGPTTGGTSVTITGTNFVSGASVTIGGTAATGVVVSNSTTITATTPAHAAGAANVTVANSDGQSATLAGGFTYNSPPAPTVTSVSPNTGPTSGGTAVTITGTNFVASATVTLGGTAATNVVVTNSTTITATTPAHAAGAVNVVVTNTDNQSGTLANGFTYQTPPPPPAPTVGSITPNSGPTTGGTSVTITGTNFVSGASVSIGGTAATGVSVNSSTSITATTPAHAAGAANVVVTNPDNQSATLAGGFTYQTPPPPPAPTVSNIAPNSGSTAGGTAVTITGTGFQAGATVALGGTAATNVVVSNSTTITATAPPHGIGAVNVVVTNTDNQSGTLANGFTYAQALETPLLVDDFNDNALDQTKWQAGNLFSGFTDAALPTIETNQRLEIGALLQQTGGSHYNGLVSRQRYNFTNAYVYVAVVQAPAVNTTADAMFTIGQDANNYYRIYEEAGVLYVQKRLFAGSKVTMWSAAYDVTAHRYWRIRHDQATGNVVFETAPDNSGTPGSWVIRYSEAWSVAAMPLGSVLFEVKGGTWQAESGVPGKVIFDDFKAAKP
jgi:phosphatidylserine/phosphatidylglycerophosphate/cardiolipin synthase-like enzyme